MKTLFLASQSRARRELLTNARIPFTLLEHSSDELQEASEASLQQLVTAIALHKMETIIDPEPKSPDCRHFIVTADTLCQDQSGLIHAKPTTYADAFHMLQALRDGGLAVGSAFVIRRITYAHGVKRDDRQVIGYASAFCELDISDEWIKRYLENQTDYLKIAGTLDIQSYGAQFVKRITGSVTAVLGLPMVELRTALEQLNFWD